MLLASETRVPEISDAAPPVEEQIRRFVAAQLLVDFDGEINDSSDLFQLGLLDSFGYIQLIKFAETTFGVAFTTEEMLLNVVVSVDGMASLVRSKHAKLMDAGAG
jgi:acyl carrier protein